MVAIVTGQGLGLGKSSANILGAQGQLGSAGLGRANDGVTVNAATGNLVIGNRDELLIGRGPDLAFNRTYNSLGVLDGDNNDNWRNSQVRRIDRLTGTANSAGSTLTRTMGDGSEFLFTWDTSRSRYVSKDGSGGYETIYQDGSYWIWTNSANTQQEWNYTSNGFLIYTSDMDRAAWVSYGYTGSLLTAVATGDGSHTTLTYSGNNLQSLTTSYQDAVTGVTKTLTRTRYAYDGYNRLATVTTDLSPEDNSVADGRVYTTTYTYHGASKLVASIAQTDGSLLTIAYDGANRVSSVTQTVENGITRTTSFGYGAGYTNITDAQGNVTTMYFDGAGQHTRLIEPAATAGAGQRDTSYSYDGNGNMTYTSTYVGGVYSSNVWYRYDANGNLYDTYATQAGKGYEVTRFHYGSKNELLTSTTYAGFDADGHGGAEPTGGMTTRYVYNSTNNLRFVVSPEGFVSEYRYNALGQRVAEISYTINYVGTGGLAETFTWAEGDFINWLASIGDKSATARTDTSYDFRGNVQTVISYAKVDIRGNGILAAGYSQTHFVYDQYGNLLSKQQVQGEPIISHTSLGEWAYSGLNMVGAGTSLNGQPANQYTVQTAGGWSAFYNSYPVAEGDTVTTSITLKGTGTSAATSIGLYGYQSSWGDNKYSTARIVSGPGTISQEVGSLWNITGLSNTEETRVEITRTYLQGDNYGGVYNYADRPNGWRAGQGVIASDPVVTKGKAAIETYAYDGMGRTIRFTDAKGVGTWTTYIDAQSRTVVTLANGLTQTSSYNKAGELVGFAEAKANFVQENAISSDITTWPSIAARTPAGTVDGAPATLVATASGQSYSYSYSYAYMEPGETQTWSLSLQGNGSLTSAALGIWAGSSGWGSVNMSTARIISGPGTLSQDQSSGGYFTISGLSATEATRIEVTRVFTQAEYGYPHFYTYGSVGQGVLVSAQSISKGRYNESNSTAALANSQFDINQWGSWGVGITSGPTIGGTASRTYTAQGGGAVHTSFSAANAGDTITAGLSFQGTATGTNTSFGIYGDVSDWGRDAGSVTARIISGPGTLTQEAGYYQGLWNITGLVAGQTTRVEISRTFSNAESGGVYFYPARPSGYAVGHSIIVGAPSIVRTQGDLTAYKYDSLGRLRIKRDPSGARTFYYYDKLNRKIGEVAQDGAVTEFKYDAEDRVLATARYRTPLNATQIASLFDWYGNSTAVEFSSLRPTATGTDRWSWTTYDTTGRAVQSIDASGTTTAFLYDGAGRIIKTTRYNAQFGASTLEAYKASPPPSFVQPGWDASYDRTTSNFYDKDSRLVGTLDEELFLTEYVYDKAGRQIETIRYANAAPETYRPIGAFNQALPGLGTLAGVKANIPLHANDTHDYVIYDSRGLIAARVDGEGNVTRYSHDARGNVAQEVRGQKVTANTLYTLATLPAASGQLQITNFIRDAVGQVTGQTQVIASGNSSSSLAYNSVGNVTSATDARGYTTNRFYDARGRLVRQDVPIDGSTWATTRYEYDSRGNVVKVIDPRGNASYNYYDERSRLVLAIDAEGYATRTTYNVFSEVSSVTRYYLKASGVGNTLIQPTISGHGQDATTSFARDNRGLVTTSTDAQGASDTNYYNAFGETYYKVNKLGGGESIYYTRRGQLYYSYTNEEVRQHDGGIQLSYRYKNLYVYDARGNVAQMVEGYALTERRDTIYSYDRANRLIQKWSTAIPVLNIDTGVTTNVYPTENYKYDARGNLIETSNPHTGARALFYYDEANRKIAEITLVSGTSGTHKTWGYDLNGNVTAERVYGGFTTLPGTPGGAPPAPNGTAREVQYVYDRANRLIEKRIPSVIKAELVGTVLQRVTSDLVTSIIYDAMGNVVRELDGRGNSIFHYYDKNGREIGKVDQENYLTTWRRDSEGNALEDRRFANKVGTQYAITPSATTSITDLVNSSGYNGSDRITVFEYDKMGRRTLEGRYNVSASAVSGNAIVAGAVHSYITYTYNAFGEVTSKTEATGDRTDYTYDAYGRMTAKIDPYFVNNAWAGVRLVTHLYYDGHNNLVYERPSEYNSGADARANRYHYGTAGRLEWMIDTANFKREYFYDSAGRVVRERYTRTNSLNQGIREDREKIYDLAGRVTGERVYSYNTTTGATSTSPTATTQYNAYGDVSARGFNGSTAEQMFYDNAGRVSMSSAGDGVWKFFVYDANGNAVVTMTNTAAADLGHWWQEYAFNYLTGGGNIDIASFNQYYTTATVAAYDRRNLALETYEPGRTVSSADQAVNTIKTLNTRRWYNAFGEVTQERSARGFLTNYAYNTMGRVIQVQAPEVTVTFENGGTARQRPTENYAYDISGRQIGTQNANGFWTTRVLLGGTGYGDADALVRVEYRADGSYVQNGYDVYQNVRWSHDGLGRYTYHYYDNANRLIQTTRPSGNYDKFVYDELGQRIKHSNNVFGDYVFETTDYDGQGRVTSTKNYAGDVTTYSYSFNAGGGTGGLGTFGTWTKTTSRPDYLSSYETTDIFGRMVARTDLGGRVYTYTYNEAGQLAQQTSSAGQNITYSYHNTGRMATMFDNAGAVYGASTSNIDGAYNYDEDGNRTYERLAGTTTWYDPYVGYGYGTTTTTTYQEGKGTYDEMGRLVTFTDAGASGNGAVSITNSYDAAGNVRRTQATHATFNANQTLGGNITDDYWYKYDALNRMTLVKGSLIGGAIVRGTVESREITYNAAGERATQAKTLTGYSSGTYLNWAQESREIYAYNADGQLTGVNIATGAIAYGAGIGQPAPVTGIPAATGPGVARAATTYDGLGRVTDYREFDAAGTITFNRYYIAYDYRNAVTSETTSLRRYENDGYLYVSISNIYNNYGLGGLLYSSSSSNYRYKNGTQYQDSPDTSNTYTYANWDSPMQSTVTFRPNLSQSTTYTTSFNYDVNGHLTTAQINDGRPRTVTYVNDANGQILTRTETDNTSGGDPKQVWWFFDGKQVGSTGNNGNDDPDFETALQERVTPGPAGTQGAFRNGSTVGSAFSDFDQAYNSLSPGEGGGAGSAYLVRSGDTVSSIAQSVYGDSSLWYMIAEANGLRAGQELVAGQSITIPAKLANFNNRSDTFRPYDSARSIGDTQPTTPKPPKKPKCGVFGMILLIAIAAAVTYFTAGTATAALGGSSILGGAASAALGSIASQVVGVATGIQDKFSFKSLALAAVGGAVGGALKGFDLFGKTGLGKATGFFNDFARASAGSAITQGIGVATGLQKKFSWGAVAAAGAASAVGNLVGKALKIDSLVKTENGSGGWTAGKISLESIVKHGVTGMARALASGAAQSIVEGTDFGDNVLAALPGEIGNTLGMAFAGAAENISRNIRADNIIDNLGQGFDTKSYRDFAKTGLLAGHSKGDVKAGLRWQKLKDDGLLRYANYTATEDAAQCRTLASSRRDPRRVTEVIVGPDGSSTTIEVYYGLPVSNRRDSLPTLATTIRSSSKLGSNLEKDLWENFILGGGDYQLNDAAFSLVAPIASRQFDYSKATDIILSDGSLGFSQSINFYGDGTLDWSLGTATVYFRGSTPVGVSDVYDFDAKSWGTRGYTAESATRFANMAKIPGVSAAFDIRYGVQPHADQTNVTVWNGD